MLRRIVGLTLLVTVAALRLRAQNAKNETIGDRPYIGPEYILGHGLLPVQQAFAGAFTMIDYSNTTATGVLSFTYRYQLSKLVSLGFSVSYEHEAGTWRTHRGVITSIIANYTLYGTFSRSTVTVAPEVTLSYSRSADGFARLYGLAGIGLSYRQFTTTWDNSAAYPAYGREVPDISNKQVAFQLSPIGLRVGRALCAFAELGLGYKGLINYGLTYRL